MTQTVLIRVDASPAMGGGHVARCNALAIALVARGFAPRFVTATESAMALFTEDVPGECLSVDAASDADLEGTLQIAGQLKPLCIVLDGYHFDSRYHCELAKAWPLVAIDDENNRGLLNAAVVVNHTAGVKPENYRDTAPNAELLLGVQFALLSPWFQQLRNKSPGDKHRLLVCFGASDVQQRTLSVVEQLGEALGADAPVDVVCGALCANVEAVELACKRYDFRFYHNCKTVAKLIQQAALAIAAPGTMLYELACLGVPTVFAIAADNQIESARYHQRKGWCEVFEQGALSEDITTAALDLWSDRARRQAMAAIARNQVDGAGARRVAEFLWCKFVEPATG